MTLLDLPVKLDELRDRSEVSITVDAAELDRQRNYWRRQLTGLCGCLSLRTDYPRSSTGVDQESSVEFRIPRDLLVQLQQLSQQHGVTLYVTLLSAFAVLLGGYSENYEPAISSSVTNRPRGELEQLVGYFVNMLVMRLDVPPGSAFTELLTQGRRVVAEAHEHKDLPLADLVRDLVPVPDPSYLPLFQVMFNLIPDPIPGSAPQAGGVGKPADFAVVPWPSHPGTAKFDLALTAQETASGPDGYLEYSADLFARRTAEGMARYYERLLQRIAAAPETDLTRLRAWADQREPESL